jgi:hypothetical protein
VDHSHNENEENIAPNNERTVVNAEDIALTKKGLPRKRKPKLMTPQMRKQLKAEKSRAKHSLKPPCPNSCRKKCISKIDEDQRKNINNQIWSLSPDQRRMFILSCSRREVVNRHRGNDDSKRKVSF